MNDPTYCAEYGYCGPDILANFPGVHFKGPWINIWGNPRIGEGTEIAGHVEVGNNVVIGRDCRISAFVFLPPGVRIGNGVFLGPACVFTNDKHPPSPRAEWRETVVHDGAVIGAGAVILPGITIGERAVIGAGAVVTKDVPAGGTWVGNPARKLG